MVPPAGSAVGTPGQMPNVDEEDNLMKASPPESARIAGPNDEDPNVVWFAEECRRNHVRFEPLLRLADRVRDPEFAAFLRRAQAVSHKLSSAAAQL
jgi:hypothetical protein